MSASRAIEGPICYNCRAGLALIGLIACLAITPTARAYHSAPEGITERTGRTIERGIIDLGLWRTEYGVFSWLAVGTYNPYWLQTDGLTPPNGCCLDPEMDSPYKII